MPTPVQSIADLVRQRVRRDGVDLGADPETARRYARDAVRGYSERAHSHCDGDRHH